MMKQARKECTGMPTLDGYEILHDLPPKNGVTRHAAHHIASDARVCIHFLPLGKTPKNQLESVYRHFLPLKTLISPHVARVYAVLKITDTPGAGIAFAVQAPEGQSLKDRLAAQGPLPVGDFLRIAIQIVTGVNDLHRAGLTHGGLAPWAIFLDPKTHHALIGDFAFGMAALVFSGGLNLDDSAQIRVSEDHLPYISPEQTGRMNRETDYRTDFYSLGVIFHEMLTGRPPFSGQSPMSLIHAHMAREPVMDEGVRAAIGRPLAAVIAKLLAKSPENRYQSAFGLKWDLTRILDGSGDREGFSPGVRDIPEHFQFPDQMYGREIEIAMMVDEFNRVRDQSSIGISMIAGYSGVGKSRLVEEIRRYVVKKGSFFISGQYQPFQQDIPYSGLIQAFQKIIRQILTGPAEEIAQWRAKLTLALGSNARIIMDVIPEVAFILGPQPEALELPPGDARNRFHLVFEKFLRVFAAREHPLTLFIDNMHWADAAGLKLMEAFFSGTRTRNVYFIGAYRSNEISPNHPLPVIMETLKRKGISVSTISLQPLRQEDICRLLADTLHETQDQAQLPARVIHDKTRGNPFFVRRFLETITGKGFLYYDFDNGRWQWRLNQIAAERITDNVIDFMAQKVAQLTDNSQMILRLAACIGNTFSLSLLSRLAEKPSSEVLADLKEAVGLGLITPLADPAAQQAALPVPSSALGEERGMFEFLHDRVRLAAYSLSPELVRRSLHQAVGRLMLSETSPEALPGRVFAIVHHLNLGEAFPETSEERRQLADLNLMAGKRAKDAAAYGQAVAYLATAEKLLAEDGWGKHFGLMFDILNHRMECEYLLHHFKNAEDLFKRLLARAEAPLDKAAMFNQKMIMLASLARHEEALDIGTQGLRLLGVRLPRLMGPVSLMRRLTTLRLRMRRISVDTLLDAPVITDAHRLLILKMMMNLALSAYFCNPYFATCLGLMLFKMALKYGNSAISPFAYVIYGATQCAIFKDYDTGAKYGNISLIANRKFGGPQMTAKVLLYYANAIVIWQKPISQVIALIRDGLRAARETGDLNYAVYHIQTLIFSMLAAGASLDDIFEECGRFYEFVDQSHDVGALYDLISVQQFVKCLRGQTVHSHSMNDDGFSEARHVKKLEPEDLRIILCRYYLLKLRMLYIMEDYDGAFLAARRCGALARYHLGTIIIPEYLFYHGLTLAKRCPGAPFFRKSVYFRRLLGIRNQFKKLSAQCPENFEDKYLLLEAAVADIRGWDQQATALYQQAAAAARAGGFLQNHAIACESAACFYLSRGQSDAAAPQLANTLEGYRAWGAGAKVKLLQKRFADLLAENPLPEPFPPGQHLDFQAIVTALQTLSTEILIDELLKRLMKLVLENAGARKVQFLSITDNQLFLEAESQLELGQAVVHPSIPANGLEGLFHPALNYVMRTGAYMALDDAVGEGDFTKDPYVLKYRPKSVLCLPVIRHDRRIALLYLENNITSGVFTPRRIKVLQLLASQAAISLENARLYQNVIQNEKQLREVSAKREEESLKYQSQLRSLSSEVSLAEERERRRIASDLHDRIGHALANASMKLRLVKNAGSMAAAAKHIDAIHVLIDQSIQDTQTLTFELSPPILYDLGLEAALDWLAEQTQRQHDIEVRFVDDGVYKPIEESRRVLLFQATRELLHNVVKHARATRVEVSISAVTREDAPFVRIAIKDNGVGFAATKKETGVKKGGFGIFSIQERLKHQGGSLDIASSPETGSVVTIISPMTVLQPAGQEGANEEDTIHEHQDTAGR